VSRTTNHDVIVVGAGPAGSAAATILAEGGLDVVVLDKATFPRDKTCGDGLTTLALRELEALGIHPGQVASWTPVDGAHLHSPRGTNRWLPLPTGTGQFAAVARRIDLDATFVERAISAGATLREGDALTTATCTDTGVEVHTRSGDTMSARWVIGADGVWSPLRKALGIAEPGYRGEWHAFRQYVEAPGEGARELHVWFERDLLPGYAWSFPLPDGRVNVGFGILRGDRLDGGFMAALWSDLLERPSIRAVLGHEARPESPHRAWPIPARITTTVLASQRALFVGDAARSTDLFTGEGIGQALLTGRRAAEAILRSGEGEAPELVGQRYSRSVLHELAPDHRMATVLSRLMTNPWLAEGALAVVGTNDWTRRNVARWLFEDSPRGIALTPRRWRRGALSGPAPFTTGTRP
jgi:menaquinone-9 beta-reductase